MAENSKIEWCHHTQNFWIGCAKISPGCDHCYAAVSTPARAMKVIWGANAERHVTGESNWNNPLRWNKNHDKFYAEHGTRQRVFCQSLSDVFDNHPGVVDARARMWQVIKATPNLDWLLLTKRIGNAKNMLPEDWGDGYPNVWLGASIVNQEEADRDIPKLLDTPARIRWLSMEPLLGPVDLRYLSYKSGDQLPEPMRVNSEKCSINALTGVSTWPTCHYQSPIIKRDMYVVDGHAAETDGEYRRLDWIVCGGESGHQARPMVLGWAKDIVRQCKAAGVPVLMKQLGARPTNREGQPHVISDRKGAIMAEWPEELRIREYPEASA